MEETSHPEERADIKTRWQKGQSGNPTGRRLRGAGATLTGLARTMMERPVNGADGERHTRLAEYMIDVVRRADAGDFKSRMFLLKAIDRGDSRKLVAQRNAKKAKTEELRKFEEEKAAEISDPMPPLSPEMEDEHAATVSPTVPSRIRPAAPAHVQATVRGTLATDASSFRRDPRTGHLLTPEGRELSREEEEQLRYPNWPHISPHLKKTPFAGDTSGDPAGRESPARESQVADSAQDSGSEKFSQKAPPPERDAGIRATARPIAPSDVPAAPTKEMPSFDAASLRRDPRTGNLVTPEGRVLSPEEEDQWANAFRPVVFPHSGTASSDGISPGNSAGHESPAADNQTIDSTQYFGSEKFSQENRVRSTETASGFEPPNADIDPCLPRVAGAPRERQRA